MVTADTWKVLGSWKHSLVKCLLHVLQYGRLRQREHKPPYAMWATPQLELEATNTYAKMGHTLVKIGLTDILLLLVC